MARHGLRIGHGPDRREGAEGRMQEARGADGDGALGAVRLPLHAGLHQPNGVARQGRTQQEVRLRAAAHRLEDSRSARQARVEDA